MSRWEYGPVALFSIALEPSAAANGRADARSRERRAVAALAGAAFGGAEILHHPDGAPYVEGHPEVHISVSHSTRLAVLAVAPVPVGVDIEEPRTALRRVAARFLTEAELEVYAAPADLLRAWTLKEAAFKALRPDVPATAMPLPPQTLPYTILYSGPHPDAPATHLTVVTK